MGARPAVKVREASSIFQCWVSVCAWREGDWEAMRRIEVRKRWLVFMGIFGKWVGGMFADKRIQANIFGIYQVF
jgi:hypothetical protein